jgi:hypothetical protein
MRVLHGVYRRVRELLRPGDWLLRHQNSIGTYPLWGSEYSLARAWAPPRPY